MKTKCTFAIVNSYVEINKFKREASIMSLKLLNRLKSDSYMAIAESNRSFMWRNFSAITRKVGTDLSWCIYLILTIILFYSAIMIQYNETG